MGIDSEKRRVAFYTLGCKLNFTETSTITREFEDHGFEKVSVNEKADVYVINTCTVTQIADKKSRQMINKLARLSPEALIVVVGCYSQINAKKVSSIEGVDLILGNHEKFEILKYIDSKNGSPDITIKAKDILKDKEFKLAYSIDDRTRSFIKVQDGCDYFCAYCTVPYARGRSRNGSIADVVNVANEIANKGIKEIVLSGINLGDYGKSTGDTFFDLIKELDRSTDVERYRISSIEPNLLSNEIIEFVNSSYRFMPHFHMPLQSGSDRILGLMKRRYDTTLFKNKVKNIFSIDENTCVGVDIIVGFPDEQETDYSYTYRLLDELDVSYLHVFTYSDREKAKSFDYKNKISANIKEERSRKLQALSDRKRELFYRKQLKKEYNVLFEAKNDGGYIQGFTENYVRAEYAYQPELAGKIKRIRLKSISLSGNVNVEILK